MTILEALQKTVQNIKVWSEEKFFNKKNIDSELSSTSENPVQNKVIADVISSKSDTGHIHDDRYYTETEVDNKLNSKSNTSHGHGLMTSSLVVDVADTTDGGWELIQSDYNPDGGKSGHVLKSIRTRTNAPEWIIGNYSSGIVFGGGDTKGVMTTAYNSPNIKFAAGNNNAPVWHMSVVGKNGKTYDLDALSNLGGYGFSIPAHSAATIIFDNNLHSAIISCRAAVANRYATFIYSGYLRGGIRSNVCRIYGDENITYGIRPESTDDKNGIVLWNHGEHTLSVTVLSLLGSGPIVESGDGGATEIPYEWDNPSFVYNTEYLTKDRYNGSAIYKKLTSNGILQYKVGESGEWKNYYEITGAKTYTDNRINESLKEYSFLPEVTTADNGKVLMVVDGKWQVATLSMSVDSYGALSI